VIDQNLKAIGLEAGLDRIVGNNALIRFQTSAEFSGSQDVTGNVTVTWTTNNCPEGSGTCQYRVTVKAPKPPGRDDPPERNLQSQEPQNNPPGGGGAQVPQVLYQDKYGFLYTDPRFITDDAGDPVYLHNGEAYVRAADLQIPGRGFDWKFERTYRSGITFNGPLGQNWEFNYNRRLVVETGGAVLRMDGYGRADRYQRIGGRLVAPTGFYTQLTQNPDGTFIERDRNGAKVVYSRPDPQGIARMTELRDRHGNRMRFEYNAQGQLIRVSDTLGRPINYSYNADGRLVEVRDFINRSIKFEYDQQGDLVAVTSPAVTGTPTGNDFPQGKTTRYSYSSGFANRVLNHNLLTITAPNEVASGGGPRVRFEYDTDPNSLNLDRVVRQINGGTNTLFEGNPKHEYRNSKPSESFRISDFGFRISSDGGAVPAGGTISYEYRLVGVVPPNDFSAPMTQTLVTDRNGNRTEYQFNQLGNIVRIREFTNRNVRASDPEFFETRYEYNKDGEMARVVYPEGNSVEYVYDDRNTDRFQQGNLLTITQRPDAKRGGDQASIRTSYTYEPIYNQVRSVSDARGNDPSFVPPNGGANSQARYTTTYTFDYQEGQDFAALAREVGLFEFELRALMQRANVPMGLGDVNGDRLTNQLAGNAVRAAYPTVNLLPGSNMARIEGGTRQAIVELFSHNQFGQTTRRTDPEGNVTVYDYHPENDPDGDGRDVTPGVSANPFGYLKQVTQDAASSAGRNSGTNPTPTSIRRSFFYDRVGNLIREVDGRGIATDYVVNQLNQVVQIVHAAATNVFAPDPAEPQPLTSFRYLERVFYNFNNKVIRHQLEDRGNTSGVAQDNGGSGTAFADTRFKYDILDNLIETEREVSDTERLVTRYRYDRNENLVLVIQPEGNAVAAVYDERDLLFQITGGATSAPPLAQLAASDPTGFNVRGGEPSTKTSHYDLNRNLIESVDADDTDGSAANNSRRSGAGDRTRYIFDGFDRLTSIVDAVGNQVVFQHDPAGNTVRVSRFGPVGGASPTADGPDALPMPVSTGGVIQMANLVSRNLLAATENFFDELNRRFQTDRVLFVNTTPTVRPPNVADGAADIGKGNLTPADNQAIPGIAGVTILGRVSTRSEYDRNSRRTFIVQDDGDTARTFYDGVDRVIRTVDPEGNSVEAAYDDNDNVIETRETDVSQVAGVPNEMFLTTYFHDSLGRLGRRVSNIGQTFDYRYDSRSNLVAMADAQGPTGPMIVRRAFMGGALTSNTTNLFGNVTLSSYDGINRLTRQDTILTATGQGDGVNIGADQFGVKATTPTPDLNQAGGDGLITTRYEWDRNSLLESLTDDNGNQTGHTYDNLNRRLTQTKGICVPPALANKCGPPTTIAVEYDPDDNVIRAMDENGSVRNYEFDAINRRIMTSIRRAPGVVGTTALSYEYDGLSRLTRATDNNEPDDATDDSTVARAYDSLNRVLEETQQIGALMPKAISSAWRAGNLRTGLTYPNGRQLAKRFDLLDRVDQISDQQPIANYDYIGAGRTLQRAYPINGARMSFLNEAGTVDVGYDGLRRPVQLRHLGQDNSLIVGFGHLYDRMSNKRNEEKLHALSDSELYRYDSAYRLISFDRGSLNAAKDALAAPSVNVPLHKNWTLDGVGNWQRVDAETREHSSFNEITVRSGAQKTAIMSNDNNGNMTSDDTFIFAWDYANRLRTVTRKADGARIAVYSYDAMGRRIRKVVTNSGDLNGTTDFYLDGWQEIEERDARDGLIQQYVYGRAIDEPLVLDKNQNGNDSATDASDRRFFYHQNTLFSVFALSDSAGRLVESYQYDAYGRQTIVGPGPNSPMAVGGRSAVGNPFMFTGRRFDPETGLYYYRMRYLDAELGRFISRDPIGYAGGIGLYEYVGGRATVGTDAMGLDWSLGDALGTVVDVVLFVPKLVMAAEMTILFGGTHLEASPIAPPTPPKPRETPPSDTRPFPWEMSGMARPGTGVAYETTAPPDKDLSRKVQAFVEFQMGAAGIHMARIGAVRGFTTEPDMPRFRVAGGRASPQHYKWRFYRYRGQQNIRRNDDIYTQSARNRHLQAYQKAGQDGRLNQEGVKYLTDNIDRAVKQAIEDTVTPDEMINSLLAERPDFAGPGVASGNAPVPMDDMPGLFGGGNPAPQGSSFNNMPTERIVPPRNPNMPPTERNIPVPPTERNIRPPG
jgi:RHS repeat-associated protein